MRRMRGLSTRLLLAIALIATFQLAVFATLLVELQEMRDADHAAQAAAHVSSAVSGVEAALAQFEATERDVALAGTRPRLMRAWRRDAAEVQRRTNRLVALAGESQRPLIARIRAYLRDYAESFVLDARSESARARRARHLDTGEPRLEALRTALTAVAGRLGSIRTQRRDEASSLGAVAQVVGVLGVLATLVCAVGFLAYARRAILRPLRRMAGVARALAAGDLRARVADHGAGGEVGELARTFDQMAASLEDSRAALERRNDELATQSVELVGAVRSAREGASVLRAVLDATPDAIALLDREGAVLVDNPPMRELRRTLGSQATAIDEHGVLVQLEERDAEREQRDEITLLGTRRAFARYATPVHDGRQRLIGQLLVLREVTAEHEAEHAKEDFFALVSHELRTPLTAILGYVELVLGDDGETLAEEHARHLAVVERNARRLLRLVGDLLFAAQLEVGSLLLEPAAVDLPRLVEDAIELARPRAQQAGVALEADIAPLPRCLGDHDRLVQVLENLLSNAVKFTPAGGRVEVRLAPAGGSARLEVRDTGVGIPAADLPHLFERFYRAANATERAIPGLGLGLMIARAIVEGHGGTIAVESEVGSGTAFVVELPLRAVSEAGALPVEPYRAGGL